MVNGVEADEAACVLKLNAAGRKSVMSGSATTGFSLRPRPVPPVARIVGNSIAFDPKSLASESEDRRRGAKASEASETNALQDGH